MMSFQEYSNYNVDLLKKAGKYFLHVMIGVANLEVARERLYRRINTNQFDTYGEQINLYEGRIVRIRDCSHALNSVIKRRSDKLANFSVVQALYDIANNVNRPDLQPGFYAELYHLFMAIQGKGPGVAPGDYFISKDLSGKEAAIARSKELDLLWGNVSKRMSRFIHGFNEDIIEYRKERRKKVLSQLRGTNTDWRDWRWHLRNVIKRPTQLYDLIPLSDSEVEALEIAERAGLPFGITPYYLSLIDDDLRRQDRALRAQVIPPLSYVEYMAANRHNPKCAFDFMMERDTSPIDLITRRYPSIVILKPYNSCPQICVYCQRNWEIEGVLSKGAMASKGKIEKAIAWIKDHPSIQEVLVTGGDPLSMSDTKLFWILEELAKNPNIEMIRVGTRTPVTIPMRITNAFARALGKLRRPMRLDVSVVTHVEHPYEITPDVFRAAERLRRNKINVYNQSVFTFFNSRRFESAFLRRILKRVGIEPYYTFNTKGKNETIEYRVPIARLLQEQKEEARLLPGLSRTDEAVYNLPALGKQYLRASQHRDVISVLPDGSRVYEFHPWEKNIRMQDSYIGIDIPILDYLKRLENIGEDISEYQTIWYYF